jgi:dihydroflavonol-4-reductase
MRVLITGGTGFIGRPLTRKALQRGWEVTVVVRAPDSKAARELADMGANLVLGDVTDRATLEAAFSVAQPELFFHNAGWYELGIPRRMRRRTWGVNVEGTENALTLAAEYEVRKAVYTSSTTALGDTGGELVDESFKRRAEPLSYYEYTKREAHALAGRHQAAGEPVVIACPAQAVGPGDHSAFGRLARLFVRGLLPPFVWAPGSSFTFGHVDDVATALILAGEKGKAGELYFTAGKVLTLRKMLKVWGDAANRKPPFIWLPKAIALAQAALIAPLLRLAGKPAFISPEVVRSSFVSFRYSSAKAEAQLGAEFRSAEQAWSDTIEKEFSRTSSNEKLKLDAGDQ